VPPGFPVKKYSLEITKSLEESVPQPVKEFFVFYDIGRLISIHSIIRTQIHPVYFLSCSLANIDVKLGSILNS
jgi:hypothetical protein